MKCKPLDSTRSLKSCVEGKWYFTETYGTDTCLVTLLLLHYQITSLQNKRLRKRQHINTNIRIKGNTLSFTLPYSEKNHSLHNWRRGKKERPWGSKRISMSTRVTLSSIPPQGNTACNVSRKINKGLLVSTIISLRSYKYSVCNNHRGRLQRC